MYNVLPFGSSSVSFVGLEVNSVLSKDRRLVRTCSRYSEIQDLTFSAQTEKKKDTL